MLIRTVSVPVLDQSKALAFYTDILGFIKKHDIPLGGENRWLTVVSPEELDGPEILLEPSPNHLEEVKVFQKSMYDKGMPLAQFNVINMDSEYSRLTTLGVKFSVEPNNVGTAIISIFDDTCGNNIQLVQIL